jgi:benzoylformate decarboxylase
MDRLVEQQGGSGPWPNVDVDVAGLARAFGCPARTIEAYDELNRTLDEVLPNLADRQEPLLLEVKVAPDASFSP